MKKTKILTREEIFAKVTAANKRAKYQVSWITDVLPVTTYTNPETGETTTINVTVVAKTTARLNIKYKNIKSVIARGELAARTKVVGGKEVVSKKRENWWKHMDKVPSLCYHKEDEGLSDDSRRWYLQLFTASATNRDPLTGKFIAGSTKITPELEYIFMMGTDDEEILIPGTTEGDAILAKLAELRPTHEKPAEVWFKKFDTIVAIDHK